MCADLACLLMLYFVVCSCGPASGPPMTVVVVVVVAVVSVVLLAVAMAVTIMACLFLRRKKKMNLKKSRHFGMDANRRYAKYHLYFAVVVFECATSPCVQLSHM